MPNPVHPMAGDRGCPCYGRGRDDKLQYAIARMSRLHDGDEGLIEVIGCGPVAVAPLGALLFEREPSGIYQPRCRAAAGLAALGAFDVLREFLALRRAIADPVERTGEDAVINAAARALARARLDSDCDLLLEVLRWRLLAGVIESLGPADRAEAIPIFVSALAEDDCRPAAEAALRKRGRASEEALVACVTNTPRSAQDESETSRRQRRSAVSLLLDIGVSAQGWDRLEPLINDPDARIAAFACKLGLTTPWAPDKSQAVARLVALLEVGYWMLAGDIESFLSAHFGEAENNAGNGRDPEKLLLGQARRGFILQRAGASARAAAASKDVASSSSSAATDKRYEQISHRPMRKQ